MWEYLVIENTLAVGYYTISLKSEIVFSVKGQYWLNPAAANMRARASKTQSINYVQSVEKFQLEA